IIPMRLPQLRGRALLRDGDANEGRGIEAGRDGATRAMNERVVLRLRNIRPLVQRPGTVAVPSERDGVVVGHGIVENRAAGSAAGIVIALEVATDSLENQMAARERTARETGQRDYRGNQRQKESTQSLILHSLLLERLGSYRRKGRLSSPLGAIIKTDAYPTA